MKNHLVFTKSQIAPCGINCGTCMAFLREKNRCLGCRVDFDGKRKSCELCRIKNCEKLAGHLFCFDCDSFPCHRIKHIDKRYTARYRASLLQNLLDIREAGIEKFIMNEEKKWSCPECGEVTSIHIKRCMKCSYDLGLS